MNEAAALLTHSSFSARRRNVHIDCEAVHRDPFMRKSLAHPGAIVRRPASAVGTVLVAKGQVRAHAHIMHIVTMEAPLRLNASVKYPLSYLWWSVS